MIFSTHKYYIYLPFYYTFFSLSQIFTFIALIAFIIKIIKNFNWFCNNNKSQIINISYRKYSLWKKVPPTKIPFHFKTNNLVLPYTHFISFYWYHFFSIFSFWCSRSNIFSNKFSLYYLIPLTHVKYARISRNWMFHEKLKKTYPMY